MEYARAIRQAMDAEKKRQATFGAMRAEDDGLDYTAIKSDRSVATTVRSMSGEPVTTGDNLLTFALDHEQSAYSLGISPHAAH